MLKKSSLHLTTKKQHGLTVTKRPPLSAEWKRKIGQTAIDRGIRKGEKNPKWSGGRLGWFRKLAFERDDYTCRDCGLREPEIMEINHIDPTVFYPELYLEISNLETLCPNCHRRKTNRQTEIRYEHLKGMRIILEGPDGSSKTTIVKMLKKKTGFLILKMPGTKKYFKDGDAETPSYLFNRTVCQLWGVNFLLDRGFPSSIVYTRVYKRQVDLSYLEGVEKMLNALVIILTATDKELFRRKPNDSIIDKKHRIEVKKEYDHLAKERNWSIIDTTGKDREEVLSNVLEIINRKYGTNF